MCDSYFREKKRKITGICVEKELNFCIDFIVKGNTVQIIEEREIGAALWFSYFLKTIIVGGPHM
jgi:hypothetical protein